MKYAALLTFLLTLTISGCKDSGIQPTEFTNKNLLHRQYPENNVSSRIVYYYNSSFKLNKRESYGDGKLEAKIEYFYDDKNNMIKETTYHTYYGGPEYSYLLHEYNVQNALEKSLAYLLMQNNEYEFRSTTTYEYDVNNRIAVMSIFNTDGIRTKYLELYYDSAGNVIETNFYQEGKLSFNDKYRYDDKKNPLQFLTKNIDVYNLSPNNIVEHSEMNYMIKDADYVIRSFSYEYNENNYPVSCTSGSQKVIFEYY
jgi:YD repeat-containing protein